MSESSVTSFDPAQPSSEGGAPGLWSGAALATALLVLGAAIAMFWATSDYAEGDITNAQRFAGIGMELKHVPAFLALVALLVEPLTSRRWALIAVATWLAAIIINTIALNT